MKKLISSIIIMIISIMCICNYSFAAGAQLEATIEITPSVTEVLAGDTVVFTFVTKNIVNAETGKISAMGGKMEYDKNFFELDTTNGITLSDETGLFNSTNNVSEGQSNGTITLKVKADATGSGIVKFTELEAGDGRLEDMETLGTAKTEDQTFTITLKTETPACEHEWGEYTENDDGTHSTTCTKCSATNTENHTYGEYLADDKSTHSAICTKCNHLNSETHTYQEDNVCSACGDEKQEETPETPAEPENKEEPKDETTVNKEIPKAGATTLLTMGLLIIAVIAIVMYRKNKKYEDIR